MNEKATEQKAKKGFVAAILIRGYIGMRQDIKDTLKMLRLFRKNYCIVVEATPSNMGMLSKAKDYITWGEIDDPTLKLLIEKRSEKNPDDPKKTKGFFRLQPPRKGFERKGIKTPFSKGGALGYRGEKINDLIKRMI
jgi:large subunit ribosomal protein L30